MIENGFIDGCFDSLHYGHVNALFQAKQQCNILHCATHTDDEIFKAKNCSSLFDYNERYILLKYCRFIDILYKETPYNTNIDILNNIKCEKFFHGDDSIDKEPLKTLNILGKLQIYKRTEGISTTDLVNRLFDYKNGKKVKTNENYKYLKNLFNIIYHNIHKNKQQSNKKIFILDCNWDYLNKEHINLLLKIKEKYPNILIYVDLIKSKFVNDYKIYNIYEIAISLLGINLIDNVIIYNFNNFDNIDNFDDLIDLNNEFKNDIETVYKNTNEKINNIDLSLYEKKIII